MKLLQVDATVEGIGTDTEISVTPGQNQRIILDYVYWYVYGASANDLLQIDTSATAVVNRKTLVYFAPTVAVHYAPIATMLNLPLEIGENFQVYVSGNAATSHLTAIVWYHLENVGQVQPDYNEQIQKEPCKLVDWLRGECWT